MANRAIDLTDLPDEAVKDVEAYVARLKKRYERKARNGQAAGATPQRLRFNVQRGTVYGDLTREEIYDDER